MSCHVMSSAEVQRASRQQLVVMRFCIPQSRVASGPHARASGMRRAATWWLVLMHPCGVRDQVAFLVSFALLSDSSRAAGSASVLRHSLAAPTAPL